MTKRFEEVARGSYGVYREKKKSLGEQVGEVIGGAFLILIVLGIVGAIIG